MKPRRITTEAEYRRLERRLVEFAEELQRDDPTLFPPDLDPDWREAFRAGYEGQLAELEHTLRNYGRRAEAPASGTGAG
ncbi:MAG: hypothetical protein H0V51_02090 [Chloroflexi bacterium]|nr:hypothetical protein [Chloroflexota bacterium]